MPTRSSPPAPPAPDPAPDDASSQWGPAGYVGFVRPPPGPPQPPLSERARRLEPLLTLGGGLIFIGLLLTLSGCVTMVLGAAAGWGPIGATGGATGLGVVVLGVLLRVVTRRLQR